MPYYRLPIITAKDPASGQEIRTPDTSTVEFVTWAKVAEDEDSMLISIAAPDIELAKFPDSASVAAEQLAATIAEMEGA